ncbi:MAG: ribbon-helix-helix domain-containing protein [Terriglobales bacterium]
MKRKVPAAINVPVRPQLRELVSAKIERSGLYSYAAEYVRDLICKDVQRDEIVAVDQLLVDGLASGKPEPMTLAWRKARRWKLAKHLRQRKPARS